VLGLPLAGVASDGTRSELEGRLLRLCRVNGLRRPEVNARVGSVLVDFVWRDRGLVVEADGFRYHRGRVAFDEDRRRGLALKALGYEVLRLGFRQIVDEPERVAEVLRRELRAPDSGPGAGRGRRRLGP
jgi:very-short-patch-repair endonuclease